MKIVFLLLTFAFSTTTLAGLPCPPDSCNQYNGCTLGCYHFEVEQTSSCNTEEHELAITHAKEKAVEVADQTCPNAILRITPWETQIQYALIVCLARTKATFICLQ